MQDVTPSTASKAARLFAWLAGEAGIEIGAEFEPVQRGNQRKTKSPRRVREPTEEPSEAHDMSFPLRSATADQYEERYLNILLEKLSQTGDIPDLETLVKIDELIQRRKKQEENECSQEERHTDSPSG